MHDSFELISPWLERHAHLIRPGGSVLDLACGSGRNARHLARQGWQVESVDINAEVLEALQGVAGIATRLADLENAAWPYLTRKFDGIVVCRYLHRPLFPLIAASLARDGVLIYETFMTGQAQFGRPSNPDFLLQADELLQVFAPTLQILAFEQGTIFEPGPAFLQRICAINSIG